RPCAILFIAQLRDLLLDGSGKFIADDVRERRSVRVEGGTKEWIGRHLRRAELEEPRIKQRAKVLVLLPCASRPSVVGAVAVLLRLVANGDFHRLGRAALPCALHARHDDVVAQGSRILSDARLRVLLHYLPSL